MHIYPNSRLAGRHLKAALYGIGGLSLMLALGACSFSDSSGSLSDSSGSVSKSSESFSASSQSSSRSFASAESKDDSRYANEVRDFTYAHYRSATILDDNSSFLKGVSSIAAEHGISDWEAAPETYRAIGKGLKKAGLEGVNYEIIKRNLADNDSLKARTIQEGYNSRD